VKRPTHRDIARLASTSQATVSLVLANRDGPMRISVATREAVLDAARELGYVPDLSARRLRQKQGASLAPSVVMAVLHPAASGLGTTTRVLEAAQAALAVQAPGSQLVLEEYSPGSLFEHPGLVAAARFHCAVVTGLTPQDERFLDETDLLVPLVAFQRRLERCAYVDVDNVAGGEAATRHLIDRGRRRIAALSYAFPPSRAQTARLDGYRRALAAAGLPTGPVELAPTIDAAGGARAMRAVLESCAGRDVDAVFALSDELAAGAMHALRELGRRIPDAVAIVGYDDLSYGVFLDPPLTTVRLPHAEMARAAVSWLVEAVPGRATAVLQRVHQPELVVRRSS